MKTYHHPFGWIEHKRVGILDATHERAVFGTKESTAGIGGIDVQPDALLGAHGPDLVDSIESAHARGAQRGAHKERYETIAFALLDRLPQRLAAQLMILVGGQDLDASECDQRRLLHTRVRLVRAVAHEAPVELGLLRILLDLAHAALLEYLGARCQQRVVSRLAH